MTGPLTGDFKHLAIAFQSLNLVCRSYYYFSLGFLLPPKKCTYTNKLNLPALSSFTAPGKGREPGNEFWPKQLEKISFVTKQEGNNCCQNYKDCSDNCYTENEDEPSPSATLSLLVTITDWWLNQQIPLWFTFGKGILQIITYPRLTSSVVLLVGRRRGEPLSSMNINTLCFM